MLLLLLFQYQMIVALGVGLKCPHKIHLNTQWGGQSPRDQLTLSETRGQIMPTTLQLAPSNFQTFLRSCSPSSNWSSSFWHEIYLNMNTRQDCWAHDLLGFCLALAFPMYVRQDIFPIFSCCLYNPHNRPDLPVYPSCLTATHYKDSYSLQELLQSHIFRWIYIIIFLPSSNIKCWLLKHVFACLRYFNVS